MEVCTGVTSSPSTQVNGVLGAKHRLPQRCTFRSGPFYCPRGELQDDRLINARQDRLAGSPIRVCGVRVTAGFRLLREDMPGY